MASKAWPFDEARRILKRYEKTPPKKATYYLKPAMGLRIAHIGTFGEVARTTMIMRAFREINDIPAKLVCFSDDLME